MCEGMWCVVVHVFCTDVQVSGCMCVCAFGWMNVQSVCPMLLILIYSVHDCSGTSHTHESTWN